MPLCALNGKEGEMEKVTKYKHKGEAHWLPFAMVKELMLAYFSIVELAHLPLPHPTPCAFSLAVNAKNPNKKQPIQTAKQYKKYFHPP